MFVIGLSGGIGCGKSAVSKYLWDDHGVFVIDCDKISKEIYEPGRACHTQLKTHPAFKDVRKELFDEEDLVVRRRLGEVVFADAEKRRILGGIVNPEISKEILKQLLWRFWKGDRFVVIDAPTLFETKKLLKLCRHTVCVYATPEQQLQRIKLRDPDLSENNIKNRIAAQISIDKKVELATYKIDNSKKEGSWESQVDDLVDQWTDKEPRFGGYWMEVGACLIITAICCAIVHYYF